MAVQQLHCHEAVSGFGDGELVAVAVIHREESRLYGPAESQRRRALQVVVRLEAHIDRPEVDLDRHRFQ